MSSLEELRKKKLEHLKAQQGMQSSEEQESASRVQQLEDMVKQLFTKEASERYSNLKVAHPGKAMNVLMVIGQGIQQGQTDKITDEQLKNLLIRLEPKKKEFNIKK
jgi:DNA-binding TFAR19-related protein (PDSD5 family)